MVLDTNTVLSALLFATGRLTWLREAWAQRRLLPLVSGATTRELIRALSYPKFRLCVDEIEVLLGEYLPFAEAVAVGEDWPGDLPHCHDQSDDAFLVLAASGRAEVLVTGDRALLELRGRTAFEIETPAEFRGRLSVAE